MALFEASEPVLFFDHFRVPYRHAMPVAARTCDSPALRRACAAVAPRGREAALWWPSWERDAIPESDFLPAGPHRLGDLVLHCRVLKDAAARDWLGSTSCRWWPDLPVTDADGRHVASVWRALDGSILLPFDPSEAIHNLWSESYLTSGGANVGTIVKGGARTAYYGCRALLPRPVQIQLRQLFTRVQARSTFPRWPFEPTLHELFGFLFRTVAELAQQPVPWIAPWPRGFSWAFVLTHDVERQVGYSKIPELRAVEEKAGFRSSWNLVPERDYEVDDALVRELWAGGYEVGVHGLRHDGRDLRSARMLERRLPAMRDAAERWGAEGFRAPSTQRQFELMPRLGFAYDSSYSDTAPYEPQPGGCCSLLPFFNRDLVELPITLPQDHNLFAILRQPDERLWLEKALFLRDRGAMALLITHPDYLDETPLRDAYARFLDVFRDDATAWRALPREVAAWWRRRATSEVETTRSGWRVVGPAASEARIELAMPPTPRVRPFPVPDTAPETAPVRVAGGRSA